MSWGCSRRNGGPFSGFLQHFCGCKALYITKCMYTIGLLKIKWETLVLYDHIRARIFKMDSSRWSVIPAPHPHLWLCKYMRIYMHTYIYVHIHVYLCEVWDKGNLCLLPLTLNECREKILPKLKLFQLPIPGGTLKSLKKYKLKEACAF